MLELKFEILRLELREPLFKCFLKVDVNLNDHAKHILWTIRYGSFNMVINNNLLSYMYVTYSMFDRVHLISFNKFPA